MPKRNKSLRTGCPFEAAMEIISGKWKGMILFRLMNGNKRFSELQACISGISQKMLTQQLRELEEAGLVVRTVFPETPIKVEYSLSETGKELEPAFRQIRDWGKQNFID